ncbi:MAG: hypothetical protein M4579_005578 [Chaenotheca gracillima]|nr:MAG: hypothetical protein M4579_005578 [Chaenotheca gracillima]
MSLAFLKHHFIRTPPGSDASSSQRSSQEYSIAAFLRKHFIRAPPPSPAPEKSEPSRDSFQSDNPLPFQGFGPSKEEALSPTSNRPLTRGPSYRQEPDQTDGFDLEAQRREQSPEGDDNGEGSSETRKRFKVDARVISDAIIGLSDGLTVPFALTAGLSTFGDKRVVIFGGLAELVAGAISMGLGGYLGAKSEAQSYQNTVKETIKMIESSAEEASGLVRSVFEPFRLSISAVDHIVTQLEQSPDELLSFLLKFHHEVSPPVPHRALISAGTIAAGYFFGGFVPLIPYFFVGDHPITDALWWSVIVMVFALFSFGYCKTCIVCGWHGRPNVFGGLRGGIEMVLVGGAAAGAAMGLVRAFEKTYS